MEEGSEDEDEIYRRKEVENFDFQTFKQELNQTKGKSAAYESKIGKKLSLALAHKMLQKGKKKSVKTPTLFDLQSSY